MNPILFKSTETSFVTNGVGILSDAISCVVSGELNGQDELQMEYPMDGIHADEIALRSLILAKRNHVDRLQPYRIYDISEPMNGIVTVQARHICYDLAGIPVRPFSALTAPLAMNGLRNNAVVDCPFVFSTDKTTAANFLVKVPSVIWSLLGGQEGSILDTYGGEYEFDRYRVVLHKKRGADNGVTIRYGKNLTDFQQDKNCSSVYTGVCPFWLGSEGNLVTLSENIVPADGTYDFVRILPLDFSAEWEEAPTEAQLRARAQSYVKDNEIGVPTVSTTISFVQLADTEEYKDVAQLETVELGDTVNVYFPKMNVSASARVVAMEYDAILERYNHITIGSVKANITDTIVSQAAEIKRVSNPAYLQDAVGSVTQLITGNKGGYVVLHSSTGGKTPDEILVMDTPDIGTAKQVWRWNKSGLGYSSTGYNGTYGLAMTMDGQIVADFITAGTLNAAQISVINLIADAVKSTQGNNTMTLDGASLVLKMTASNQKNVWLTNVSDGYPILYMFDTEGDAVNNLSEFSAHHLKVGGTSASPAFQVSLTLGKSIVSFDSLTPSGSGNCKWEYDSTLGKTILVQT